MPRFAIPILASVGTGLVFAANAGERPDSAKGVQARWTIKLVDHLIEPADWPAVSDPARAHKTEDLAFSPDGKRLAVTITHHAFAGKVLQSNTHLIIVDTDSPQGFRQIDLPNRCGVGISWNPRGDALLVCGAIVKLSGDVCIAEAAPRPGLTRYYSVGKDFWLDSEHILNWKGNILGLNCDATGDWKAEDGWSIEAVTTPKQGVVLAKRTREVRKFTCVLAVVDFRSHERINGWTGPDRDCGDRFITDAGGEVLCSSTFSDKPHCWTIEGGTELGVPKRLSCPYIVSSSWPRVVAEKWAAESFALLAPALPREREVVDMRSGDEIAKWKPRIQGGNASPVVGDWGFHCALSVDGRYIAESGDGVLELYHLAQ